MICKEVLGNLKDYVGKKAIDFVALAPDDRLKHILRLKSERGIELGVELAKGHLHDGDILGEDEEFIYVIKCLAHNVIVIYPTSLEQMGKIAHSIGNRHTPALFENNEMIIEDDYLIAQWLDSEGVRYERSKRVLRHALKHASHHH